MLPEFGTPRGSRLCTGEWLQSMNLAEETRNFANLPFPVRQRPRQVPGFAVDILADQSDSTINLDSTKQFRCQPGASQPFKTSGFVRGQTWEERVVAAFESVPADEIVTS